MLRHDLEAVGIPYVVDGPDGPQYADFHSLRHAYVMMLEAAGVTLKQAMKLARHSDPKLTLKRYGKAQRAELAAAIERMPPLVSSAPTDGPAQEKAVLPRGRRRQTTVPRSGAGKVFRRKPSDE